jgi:hypothetical protein
MQDLDPPAIPFLFKLDAELHKSKFTVWRNISWHDGSELPIFAFKNTWFLGPLSISLFLKEVDRVSIDDLSVFTEECFQYLQRSTPKSKNAPWVRPYLNIPVLVSENLAPEAINFVCKKGSIEKPNIFWTLFALPVLINAENRQIYYFRKKKFYGWLIYTIYQKLVERLIVQNL